MSAVGGCFYLLGGMIGLGSNRGGEGFSVWEETAMLYLVVHHRADPSRNWTNEWSDDNRVLTITTTTAVARQCEAAARLGERVRFHRCAYGSNEPVVCSEARVVAVQKVDRSMSLVHFSEHSILELTPPMSPIQGTNFYRT